MAISGGPVATPLPITVSIEPSEGGKVLYLRVAPPAKGEPPKAMLYFYLDITNNTSAVRTLDRITVAFPGSALTSRDFLRSEQINPGVTRKVWLSDAEVTQFTDVPPKLQVSLRFTQDKEHPVVRTWDLAPHDTSYSFFARPEADSKYGEYILLSRNHAGDGGSQTFAQDAGVVGVNNNGKLSKYRTDGTTNKDYFLWERPLYAMADGLVVRAVARHPDNLGPGLRTFHRKLGQYQGKDQIKAVSVGTLSTSKNSWSRILVGSVTASGSLTLTVLEQGPSGDQLRLVGELDGPPADQVCVIGFDNPRRACTVVQSGTDVHLILWDLSVDGKIIKELSKVTVPGIDDIKATRLSGDRLLTAARTKMGTLSLSVWQIENDALLPDPTGEATAGVIGDFDVVAVNTGRVAAAVQTGAENLKVIVWDIEGGGGGGGTGIPDSSTIGLVRKGEATTKGTISEIAAAKTAAPDQLATAVRTHEGTLAFIVWDIDEDGAVTRRQTFKDERQATDIDLTFFKTESLAAAYRSDSGTLRILALDVEQDAGTKAVTINKLHEQETFGTTDLFDMTRVATDQATIVTAVRTESGVLKVILWQYTDSNLIYVLYGDELVAHVHLRQNSIPASLLIPEDLPDADLVPVPVTRGQLIGRMGHSGKSSGPHLHIEAIKVRPELLNDVPGLMAKLRAGESVGVFRPLQFHGVLAMRNKGVQPGWKNNPLATMQGQGVYFEDYLVWPWPGEYPG